SEKGRFLAAMKAQGKDWRDPKAQAEYQIENLQKNYPNVWKEMQTHAAAGQQAADYLLGYERPKGTQIIGGKPVATGSYALQRQNEYLRGVAPVSSYTGGGSLSPNMVAQGKEYGPKSKAQEQASTASSGRVDPYGRTPHMGDMSQYHKDTSPNVTIFNKSGSNVNLQTASLGSAQGNFDA
ncbi:MAG TPA: phage tail tip lysozyme, partial [Bacteroidia bacterium]|nr:phage tail tip lysozyme [Bacteroidia bacterium]